MEQRSKNNRKSNKSQIKINNKSQQAIDEADIRQQLDDHVKALCNKDLKGVMLIYAPNIVSFDVEGNYLGAEAKRKAWIDLFSMIESHLHYEIRDLTVTVGDDVAFGFSRNRLSGKLKHGMQIGLWVRCTACFRKIDGNWFIVHEHISMPFDFESGRALLDLKP